MCVYACFLELTWRPCFVSSTCVEQRQVLCVSQKCDTEERSALHLNSTKLTVASLLPPPFLFHSYVHISL